MGKVDYYALGIRPQHTFDRLVVGSHNQMAAAASLQVAKTLGESYNPLFLYGSAGVGKTHLMQAVANSLIQKNPQINLKYITAERFINEILSAISEDNVMSIRQHYSELDLLILDDIQHLMESKSAQAEFLHVFNNLHQANRQIILAGDRQPNQLTAFEKTIRSRLEWGLAAEIKIPDYPTRIEILRLKQNNQGLNLSEEILRFVAFHLKSNVRELEGFLKKIHAYVSLAHQELSIDLVKRIILEILPEGASENILNTQTSGLQVPEITTKPMVASEIESMPVAPTPQQSIFDLPPPPVAPVMEPLPPLKNGSHKNGSHVESIAAASPPPEPVVEKPALKIVVPETPVAPSVPEPVVEKPAPKIIAPDPVPVPPAPVKQQENVVENIAIAPVGPPVQKAIPKAPLVPPVVTANESPEVLEPVAQTPAPKKLVKPMLIPPIVTEEPEPIVEVEMAPIVEEAESDDGALPNGHKEIIAVFFYPQGAEEKIMTVHKKFNEVIKKHKLKFRLKKVNSFGYGFKGKIDCNVFVNICKENAAPVAIVVGPPPEVANAHQDFYDMLSVTLDVQGISLQLISWAEIEKDYRYLNLALDIALVKAR